MITISNLTTSPAHTYLRALYGQWRVTIDSYNQLVTSDAPGAADFANRLYDHQAAAFGALLAAKRAQNLCGMTDCYAECGVGDRYCQFYHGGE